MQGRQCQWRSALGSGLLTTAGTSGGCIYRNETVFPIGKYYQPRQPHAVCQLDIQTKVREDFTITEKAQHRFLKPAADCNLCACVPVLQNSHLLTMFMRLFIKVS